MDIFQNPFYLLAATTRDNRHRILELAEERSLSSDPDVCIAAGKTLTHPRDRVAAEVAWLPGVDPVRATVVLRQLDTPNQNLLNIAGLTPIARANLLVSGVSRLSNLPSSNLVEWILAIAQSSEAINSETVCATLNADRRVSDFPEITNPSTIDDEIQKQKNYYSQVLTSALENLSITERASVLTQAVEWSTGNGKSICPILIEKLIFLYERSAQDFLEQKTKIIEAQDEKLRAMADAENPDTTLSPIVDQLLESVKEWDTLAQPIQLSKKSTGQRHDASEIAWQIRRLAIDLFNEYSKLDFSLKITNMLLEVFAEVPEIVERLTEDLKALEAEVHAKKSFEQFEYINTQVEKLKDASDTKQSDYILTPMIIRLIETVKTWNPSTQPVEANNAVAFTVREVALHLCNKHRKFDFAIQITNALIGVFNANSVGVEVVTRLTEDKAALVAMKSFENINTQVEKLKNASDAKQSDSTLTPMVDQLIETVKTWDPSTQTVETNNNVTRTVKSIAFYLWSQYQRRDFAIQITKALIGVFSGVYGMDEVNNQLRTELSVYQMNIEWKEVTINPPNRGRTGCLLQIVIFAAIGVIVALLQGC